MARFARMFPASRREPRAGRPFHPEQACRLCHTAMPLVARYFTFTICRLSV